jgi:hypothetical protein
MRGLGASGRFDVYPHVQTALGQNRPLTQDGSDRLWRAFRRALLKLGIEPLARTSGVHFRVDEFVRQAGVPLAFADDLARRMLVFAKRAGVPDEDDQDAILTWQGALSSRLQLPFSVTAARAVSADRMGFYTREFLRVYRQDGVGQEDSPLRSAMAAAFQEEGARGTLQRSALPSVLLRDSVLGVFFPAGSDREYEMVCAGRSRRVRADRESRFLPLDVPLPERVVIQANGEDLVVTPLWVDGQTNRLLFFTQSGRLKARATLAQPEPVELPPGSYEVLARFRPAGMEDDAVELLSEQPAVHAFRFTLGPGEEASLRNGPVAVTVLTENRPTLRITGDVKGTRERVEFYFGELPCMLSFPLEWLADTGLRYQVRLSAAGMQQPVVVPIELDRNGEALLTLQPDVELASLPAGLRKVVVEVSRPDEVRPLIRESLLYWKGLRNVSAGLVFDLAVLPGNLVERLAEGFRVSANGIRPADSAARVLRLVFALDASRHEVLSFTRPGVFVDVETLDDGGRPVVMPRQLGVTEPVSVLQHKNVIVSASEPGALSLGAWAQHIDFVRTPSKRLPAAFLASRLEPGRSTLRYRSDRGGLELDVLRLRQPHVVSRVATQRRADGMYEIRMRMPREPQALNVTAEDVLSGAETTLEIGANRDNYHRFGHAWLVVEPAGDEGFSVSLRYDLVDWPTGAWVFQLDGQVDGNWGRLEDADQAAIGVGLLLGDGGVGLTEQQLLDAASAADDPVPVFARVHPNLLIRWSPACWEQLKWLNALWFRLARSFRGREDAVIDKLVDWAIAESPEAATSGWMPQQAVGASLPQMFGLSRDAYLRVNEKPHPMPVGLRALGGLRDGLTPAFGHVLHPSLAAAFRNFAAVASQRAQPRSFVLPRYREALVETPIADAFQVEDDAYVPGAGEAATRARVRAHDFGQRRPPRGGPCRVPSVSTSAASVQWRSAGGPPRPVPAGLPVADDRA